MSVGTDTEINTGMLEYSTGRLEDNWNGWKYHRKKKGQENTEKIEMV